MPVQTIRDPKTGEERKVYVLPTGIGADAEAPKPQPKPQAPGGFLGTINDLNPIKQISALGSGVSTFLQTGDLNKGIAAAQKESAATTGLGRSVERVGTIGAQRAVDAARYEVDRARLAREQIAAGTSPMDVKIPSTGPEAPSAQRVRLPQWAGYDGAQEQAKNPVEDVAASILAFVPYFAVASKAGAPANALMRTLPGVGKIATGFEAATTGLKAAGGLKKVAGVFAEEAVSGAIPSAIATYYAQKPTDKTLSDGLSDLAKGTWLEGIVAKGLLIDPNDTVEQARIKQSINDAVWSVPLGGALGTGFRGGFRGIGAMASGTKRALAELLHDTVKVGQADVAMKEAVETATTGTSAAAAAPSAPAPTAAPTPRVVSGKRALSSEVYQGLRRQPMWEKTGVETQNVLEPQARQSAPVAPAPQTLPADTYYPRLNYSDINPAASPVPTASGKRYAESLAGQDQVAIEATSQRIRASFNNAAAKLGIELGPNAGSQSWSMWDIGKQLYMNANPAKSNKPYALGNPLTNMQVQSDIVDRMLGFELTKGVDAEGKRWKSWQLTQIGRKAREDAGVELGLLPDRGPQQPRSAPLTPEVAAAQLQQAQADLVTSTQRLAGTSCDCNADCEWNHKQERNCVEDDSLSCADCGAQLPREQHEHLKAPPFQADVGGAGQSKLEVRPQLLEGLTRPPSPNFHVQLPERHKREGGELVGLNGEGIERTVETRAQHATRNVLLDDNGEQDAIKRKKRDGCRPGCAHVPERREKHEHVNHHGVNDDTAERGLQDLVVQALCL
jgi:hypothetical protein